MTVASIATFSTFSKDMAEAENEFKEVEITFASELKEGDMKTVKVGEKDDEKVLISRYLGKLYATGNACSHFGVPLEGGMLFDDKVLCPAHGAGFSVVDGTPELAPGLNGLPTFPIVEKDGKYFVKVPADKLPGSVAQKLSKRDPNNHNNFVIVGGGAAGLNAAETLRQSGYTGQITLISSENVIPYDRTLITKALVQGDSKNWALRPAQYLADADIEYRLQSAVKTVNTKEKTVILESGDIVNYDKLLIATGSNVFKPNIPGVNAPNVHFVRTNEDQLVIKQKAETAKSIVVVGASFVGVEAMSSIAMKYGKDAAKSLHLICDTETPLEPILGKEIGSFVLSEHVANGVKVHSKVFCSSI